MSYAEYNSIKELQEKSPLSHPIWSGILPIPLVGDAVKILMNGLGYGIVTCLFITEGYLGIKVSLDKPPQWFLDQNHGKNIDCHVFGVEFRYVESVGS
jgi:hypothetical protein